MKQGVIILGVEPRNYFTPREMEAQRCFVGWEFYGFQHIKGITVCGVVKNLSVKVLESELVIDFAWLSSFREAQKYWVADRSLKLRTKLAHYYGAKQGAWNVAYFTHVERLGIKSRREFCVYPPGFFEKSEDNPAWLQAKAASLAGPRLVVERVFAGHTHAISTH